MTVTPPRRMIPPGYNGEQAGQGYEQRMIVHVCRTCGEPYEGTPYMVRCKPCARKLVAGQAARAVREHDRERAHHD